MAKKAKIATFMFRLPRSYNRPENMSNEDYMLEFLEAEIGKVLSDKPDLIVLPECCDLPAPMSEQEILSYYASRTGKIFTRMCEIAKENRCYIAYSIFCDSAADGVRRNSVIMIDRNGESMGAYEKNFPTVTEHQRHGSYPGEDITVFDCDFGRVGAILCFDINFVELRHKYREAGVDLILFCTMFGGGIMRNIFAFDTRSYLVSSVGAQGHFAEIFSPLGDSIASTTNYINYIVKEINLDFAVIHLDLQGHKLAQIKQKYGEKFNVYDVGSIASVVISYEGDDKHIEDIMEEYNLIALDEYLDYSRKVKDALFESDEAYEKAIAASPFAN